MYKAEAFNLKDFINKFENLKKSMKLYKKQVEKRQVVLENEKLISALNVCLRFYHKAPKLLDQLKRLNLDNACMENPNLGVELFQLLTDVGNKIEDPAIKKAAQEILTFKEGFLKFFEDLWNINKYKARRKKFEKAFGKVLSEVMAYFYRDQSIQRITTDLTYVYDEILVHMDDCYYSLHASPEKKFKDFKGILFEIAEKLSTLSSHKSYVKESTLIELTQVIDEIGKSYKEKLALHFHKGDLEESSLNKLTGIIDEIFKNFSFFNTNSTTAILTTLTLTANDNSNNSNNSNGNNNNNNSSNDSKNTITITSQEAITVKPYYDVPIPEQEALKEAIRRSLLWINANSNNSSNSNGNNNNNNNSSNDSKNTITITSQEAVHRMTDEEALELAISMSLQLK